MWRVCGIADGEVCRGCGGCGWEKIVDQAGNAVRWGDGECTEVAWLVRGCWFACGSRSTIGYSENELTREMEQSVFWR